MGTSKDSLRFNVGNMECMVISDGSLSIPNSQELTYINCLFVRTGKHAVLIDTGVGSESKPRAGKLIQNLQNEGINCPDIDTVILSHSHGDHTGGNIDAEGKLAFPNARYFIGKEEWDFWTSDPALSRFEESKRQMFLAGIKRNLLPIRDQISLLEDETEIVPGISFIKSPGHTPGHINPVLSSGGEQLLYTGNLIHSPLEFIDSNLHKFVQSFEVSPEQSNRTRSQILMKFMKAKALVLACHYPFPGLGHITREHGGWLLKPIEINSKT